MSWALSTIIYSIGISAVFNLIILGIFKATSRGKK